MKIGYARISTAEKRFDRQIDLLREHGAERIYQDIESVGKRSREELNLMLNQLRNDDLVVVVRESLLLRREVELVEGLRH